MRGKNFTNVVITFAVITTAGVIMAIVGIGVEDPGVQSILVAFGAALFAGALAFFLNQAFSGAGST